MVFATRMLLFVCATVAVGDNRLEYIRMDQLYIQHAFSSISVDTAMQCSAVCTSNNMCASISFNSLVNTCQLNDRNPYDYNEAVVNSSAYWTSFKINIGT